MTYNPKLQECPYKTSNGRCTHKHQTIKKSKHKRLCGYHKPRECEMYLEWLETKYDEENERKSILTATTTPQTHTGESINGN